MTTLLIILAVLAVLIIGAVLISRRKSEPASD
jgi:preprotein translocase subunit SecG